jgi:hypothetical protein
LHSRAADDFLLLSFQPPIDYYMYQLLLLLVQAMPCRALSLVLNSRERLMKTLGRACGWMDGWMQEKVGRPI